MAPTKAYENLLSMAIAIRRAPADNVDAQELSTRLDLFRHALMECGCESLTRLAPGPTAELAALLNDITAAARDLHDGVE